MIGQSISHFEIIEELGRGGMGVVYKAHDSKLDRMIAMKFLPPQISVGDAERTRFLQEAKAAATLNHPNVCTIYDIREERGQQFILMEYVDGETLHQPGPPSPQVCQSHIHTYSPFLCQPRRFQSRRLAAE